MKKILYVEDDPKSQQRFIREGNLRGYLNILIEAQGINVLARVQATSPDLLVMDWGLNRQQVGTDFHLKDGVVIAEDVRKHYPQLPIIILTAYTIGEKEHEAEKQDPLTRYISKTEEWKDIIDLVDGMLGS